MLQGAKCAETTSDAPRRNCWLSCWLFVAPDPMTFHQRIWQTQFEAAVRWVDVQSVNWPKQKFRYDCP